MALINFCRGFLSFWLTKEIKQLTIVFFPISLNIFFYSPPFWSQYKVFHHFFTLILWHINYNLYLDNPPKKNLWLIILSRAFKFLNSVYYLSIHLFRFFNTLTIYYSKLGLIFYMNFNLILERSILFWCIFSSFLSDSTLYCFQMGRHFTFRKSCSIIWPPPVGTLRWFMYDHRWNNVNRLFSSFEMKLKPDSEVSVI